MKKKLFLIITILLLLGCTSAVVTPSKTSYITQNLNEKENQNNVVDVSTWVLMSNGFDITLVNNEVGLIVTDWRKVSFDNYSALGLVIDLIKISDQIAGNGSKYSEEEKKEKNPKVQIKIQIKIMNGEYKLIPKLREISDADSQKIEEISIYSHSEYGRKLSEKITKEINEGLGISNAYNWEYDYINLNSNVKKNNNTSNKMTSEKRLEELQMLREKELITDEEYSNKRKEILNGI